ncbi:fusaric acid resistance protein [Chelatococcus reniformis]|uniref:Fusaric acid resistance protein n=1 Tax=Chelatococcus reniformis TaxID=1494448 RepID=A0A916U996_9HYPH|nr:fusaric acid resistance protein [Chelatococcus reniformis]
MFSAKAYAAAISALCIGLACGLPRPYWAMTAVYVVSNPMSGATVSKALDRTFGTLLGAAGAVVMVPLLVNAPELLMLAVASWTGLFLFIALHDRTPRNYVFMLAGYTLPLIALPNVGVPDTIFDVAVARSEEIIVGIVVAAVIGTIAWPQSIGQVLDARIAGWLKDAGGWAREVLRAKGSQPAASLGRQQLAADMSPLTAMISQLSHDAGTRDVKHQAEALRGRLLLLLPLLSSIADRMHALRLEPGAWPPDLADVTDRIAAWFEAPAASSDAEEPDRLRAALAALRQPPRDAADWQGLVHASLVTRLAELVDLWQDCLALQRLIAGGAATRRRPSLRHRPVIGREQHYDRGLMLFSMGSTIVATFVAGLLWIWSGWSDGANAVAFVAIACCFFGALDRPAPSMRMMLTWTVVAYVLTGVYLFAILPRINDIEILALVLAPPFLLIGVLMPRPELTLVALLMAANLTGDLGLQGRYGTDFTSYADGGLAIVAGLLFAVLWTLVTKPFGAELAARRLVRAGWADLADLATGSRRVDHAALASRTLDRLGQLTPRLAEADGGPGAVDGLADLRTGYNIIALQGERRALPGDAGDRIDAVLGGVAAFFRTCLVSGRRTAAPDHLLRDIDRALQAAATGGQGQAARTTLDALVGLRRALFPLAAGPGGHDPTRTGFDAPPAFAVAAE